MAKAPSTSASGLGQPIPGFERATLGECLCSRMRIAAKRITAFYEAKLAPHGLTIPQFRLLALLAADGEATMAEIAKAMQLDPSTLSRTLRPLEKAGLFHVAEAKDNRRIRRVRLTHEGRVKVKAAGRAWMEAQKQAREIVSPESVAQLLSATKRLNA